jgi:MurE/MurF fusion protein
MAAREYQDVGQLLRALQSAGIKRLSTHSASCDAETAFLAYPGYAKDTRPYIADALAHGARFAVAEATGIEPFGVDERCLVMHDLKATASELAGELLGHPSRDAVRVHAITGTNGKTSTALWTARLFELLDRPCGIVGTLGVGRPGSLKSTGLTTPDPVVLQNALASFLSEGTRHVAMEASSHGIAEGRMNAVHVRTAVFTNLSQDHLDYHGSMEAYAAVKARLFSWAGLERAVINASDAFGQQLLKSIAVPTISYAIGQDADLAASEPVWTASGMRTRFRFAGWESGHVDLPLIGRYNLENICAVLGVLLSEGFELRELVSLLPKIGSVPGRMQLLGGKDAPLAVVDYAHTPDALAKALQALAPLAEFRQGQICVVFGCGGDRDPTKRAPMGDAAAAGANRIIVTSDNPRSESPQSIMDAIASAAGFQRKRPTLIEDRAEAIDLAVRTASKQDVILIAGKGHENYQLIGGETRHFDDAEQAQSAIERHWSARV